MLHSNRLTAWKTGQMLRSSFHTSSQRLGFHLTLYSGLHGFDVPLAMRLSVRPAVRETQSDDPHPDHSVRGLSSTNVSLWMLRMSRGLVLMSARWRCEADDVYVKPLSGVG